MKEQVLCDHLNYRDNRVSKRENQRMRMIIDLGLELLRVRRSESENEGENEGVRGGGVKEVRGGGERRTHLLMQPAPIQVLDWQPTPKPQSEELRSVCIRILFQCCCRLTCC